MIKLKEDKAKELSRLVEVIKNNKDKFIPIKYNGDTLKVLYTDMKFYKSILYDKYILIKVSLSEEDKQKELHLLFKDKKLHHFNNEEKKQIENERRIAMKERYKRTLSTVIDDYIYAFGLEVFNDDILEIVHNVNKGACNG